MPLLCIFTLLRETFFQLMNFKRVFLLVLPLWFFVGIAWLQLTPSAQVVETVTANAAKPKLSPTPLPVPAEIKTKAVAALESTAKNIGQFGLPENRVVYAVQFAELLWPHNEKAAREIYQNAITDMRFALNEFVRAAGDEDESYSEYGGMGRYQDAHAVKELRSQLILKLAARDADAAEDFYRESHALLSSVNGATKNFFPAADETRLETQLNAITAANNPARGLAFGLAQLDKDKELSPSLTQLTARLYAKDQEKGAKLAAAILRKIKSGSQNDYQTAQTAFGFFKLAAANLESQRAATGEKKPPLLSETEVRELAEFLAKKSQTKANENYFSYLAMGNAELLKKYAPNTSIGRGGFLTNGNSNTSTQTAVASNRATANANIDVDEARRQRERRERQNQLNEFGSKLESGDAKFTLEETRQKLALTRDKYQRSFLQTAAAAAFAKRGDKETAKTLLDEVRAQLPPRPIYYSDLLQHLVVARAYIAVEPEQSFQMLDALIPQLNEIVGGSMKFGEFIAGESAISNGEIRMATFSGFFGFGGGYGNLLNGFQDDLTKLAIADFDRLLAIADKLDRPELRLTARWLILNSLLQTAKPDETNVSNGYGDEY